MVNFKEKENIFGIIDHFILGILVKVIEKEKDIGNQEYKIIKFILDNFIRIKNKVAEDMFGVIVAYTKEIFSMI